MASPARYSGRPADSASYAAVERGELVAERAVELGLPLGLGEPLLDRLQVGEGELELDDAQVLEGIRRPDDVRVLERAEDEDDGIDLADVGEELVAQPFALARPLDEPADVDDLHRGVDDVAALRHLGQPVEPVVGDLGDPDVGVLGGEGVRRGERAATGQRVVQRALAGVGQPDQPEAFHPGVRL